MDAASATVRATDVCASAGSTRGRRHVDGLRMLSEPPSPPPGTNSRHHPREAGGRSEKSSPYPAVAGKETVCSATDTTKKTPRSATSTAKKTPRSATDTVKETPRSATARPSRPCTRMPRRRCATCARCAACQSTARLCTGCRLAAARDVLGGHRQLLSCPSQLPINCNPKTDEFIPSTLLKSLFIKNLMLLQ